MHYFAVTAYDLSGNESAYSNEVSKIKFSVPSAPILNGIDAQIGTNLNLFPDKAIGLSTYKTGSIKNNGTNPLTIAGARVEGMDYRVNLTPKILLPGGSMVYRVYFKPVKKGLRQGLVIIDTDKGIVEKALSGNGI